MEEDLTLIGWLRDPGYVTASKLTACTVFPVSVLVVHLIRHLFLLVIEIGKKLLEKKFDILSSISLVKIIKFAEERAALFLQQTHQPGTDISAMLSKRVAEQLRTQKGILSIIDIILVLGQRHSIQRKLGQGGKIRRWKFHFFFVNWKSTFHKDLKEHMEHSADNARYTSSKIQNEIISLCEAAIRE